jgi:hypothetical protein
VHRSQTNALCKRQPPSTPALRPGRAIRAATCTVTRRSRLLSVTRSSSVSALGRRVHNRRPTTRHGQSLTCHTPRMRQSTLSAGITPVMIRCQVDHGWFGHSPQIWPLHAGCACCSAERIRSCLPKGRFGVRCAQVIHPCPAQSPRRALKAPSRRRSSAGRRRRAPAAMPRRRASCRCGGARGSRPGAPRQERDAGADEGARAVPGRGGRAGAAAA